MTANTAQKHLAIIKHGSLIAAAEARARARAWRQRDGFPDEYTLTPNEAAELTARLLRSAGRGDVDVKLHSLVAGPSAALGSEPAIRLPRRSAALTDVLAAVAHLEAGTSSRSDAWVKAYTRLVLAEAPTYGRALAAAFKFYGLAPE